MFMRLFELLSEMHLVPCLAHLCMCLVVLLWVYVLALISTDYLLSMDVQLE